jgi:photosystem II stability/assembly factor-like uncharacterized protein
MSWNVVFTITQVYRTLSSNRRGYVFSKTGYDRDIIYRSTDSGTSWHRVGDSLNTAGQLVVTASGTILRLVRGTVYRSTDDGEGWSSVVLNSLARYSSSIAWGHNGTVLACIDANPTSYYDYYRSTNDGLSWSFLSHATGTDLMALSPIADMAFKYESSVLYRSTNLGLTWDICSLPPQGRPASIVVDSTGTVHLGTDLGVFYSTDNGASWLSPSLGIASHIPIKWISEISTGRIFAGTAYESFTSTNAGATWSSFLGPSHGIKSFSRAVLFGVEENALPAVVPALRSLDTGNTWARIPAVGGTFSRDRAVSIYPNGTVLILRWWSEPMFGHYSGFTLSTSADTGNTRTVRYSVQSNVSPFPDAYCLEVLGSLGLVGTNFGILRSTDYGSSWTYSNAGLPNQQAVIRLAVDSTGRVYSLLNTGAGIYVSSDSGRNWQATGVGLPAVTTLTDIAVNSLGHVFVSSNGNGVYRARGPQDTWSQLVDGLTDLNVTSICGDHTGRLLAGTSSGKIFRSTYSTTGVSESHQREPSSFLLAQNYPNPFNPTTTIRFDLPQRSQVTLVVYDLLGREVKKLIEEFREAGRHSVSFDASDLSSGVYFYRLIAGGYVQTRKMIVQK